MKALRIKQCSDSMMWYRNQIGATVPLLACEDDIYWSREVAGYRNIVLIEDADVVEITDETEIKYNENN